MSTHAGRTGTGRAAPVRRRGRSSRGELSTYQSMRDFAATPEPRGRIEPGARIAPSQSQLRYVIQKHAARRLHYDFRLELNGVLKSWAIPRGPSLDPGDKRLAAHTEDHPIDYGGFEGVIPEGHYGAGRVLLWDQGTWTPIGDPDQGYRDGRLRFRLDGRKLHGVWSLVRMRARDQRGKEDWLLIKSRDEEARAAGEADITALRPESVLSRKTLEQIGEPSGAGRRERKKIRDPGEPSPPAKRRGRKVATPRPRLSEIEGATKRAMPQMISAQLATLIKAAPSEGHWLFEAKLDGFRMLCRISNGVARLFTRNGLDWSSKLKACADAAAALPVKEAWLDGEVVVLDSRGLSSFQALQTALGGGLGDDSRRSILYFVFDLIHLDGYDLGGVPLAERKRLLASILKGAGDPLRFSDHVEGNGAAFHAEACRRGLEGVIGKRRDAPYEGGRTRNWVKVKCRRQQEFVIGGFTEPRGAREGFGALLVGVHDDTGALHFAGKVGTGFNALLLRDLQKRLAKLERKTVPFANPPPGARGVHWVEPELIAQVTFAEWTGDGLVRQGAFDGLREDKPPRAIVREMPADLPEEEGRDPVAGLVITHPERILYPGAGVTKLELARYYESMAEWLLPHLEERPLTLVRCPAGHQKCFYQKHLSEAAHQSIDRVEIEEDSGVRKPYAVANSIQAVVALVQMGVLELHTWGSRTSMLERPDRMIFDLDPDAGLPWSRIVEAAQLTRTLLEELRLESFLKTTGGKGLHIVVPLRRSHEWDEVRTFSQALARHLEHAMPDRFTSSMSKQRRKGRIFIDYLRNARGATAVAAFSTRANSGAPVSTPLAWDELSDALRSDQFTLRNVAERLRGLKADPWKRYWTKRQSLTVAMKRRLGLD